MITRLIAYITSSDPTESGVLYLEDVAVAHAWAQSFAETEGRPAEADTVLGIVERWREAHPLPVPPTAGQRQQPLLRMLVSKARDEGLEALPRPCLDVLASALHIATGLTEYYPRVHKILAAYAEPLALRRKALPLVPGLTDLNQAMHYVTAQDILQAPRRSVKTFGGILLPGRGPVYTHAGPVRVLDNVPDDCMIVLPQGSCTVRGYVFGRVAARESCEAGKNIAGAVVVRDGDIRARSLLSGSVAVTKRGAIHLRSTEYPRLVFGCKDITIEESARGGVYAGNSIRVGGEAMGGQYTVSEILTAQAFRRPSRQEMDIFLQRSVGWHDYGAPLDSVANRLLARASRLRRERHDQSVLLQLTTDESEQYAANAILYLFGGDKIQKEIGELESAQRRLGFLGRIIAGIDTMVLAAHDKLKAAMDARDEASEPVESALFDANEEESEDQERERQEILTLAQPGPGKVTARNLVQLAAKRRAWIEERAQLQRIIDEKQAVIRRSLGQIEALDKAEAETNRVQVLVKLLTTARARPDGDTLKARTNAGIIRVALRHIDNRRKRIQHYGQTIERITEEYQGVAQTLERDFDIFLEAPKPMDSGPAVEGEFDAGVRISTDRYLASEENPPEHQRIVTLHSGGEIVRYERRGDAIFDCRET